MTGPPGLEFAAPLALLLPVLVAETLPAGAVREMSSARFSDVMLKFVPASFVVGAGMELFMLNTVSAQEWTKPCAHHVRVSPSRQQ